MRSAVFVMTSPLRPLHANWFHVLKPSGGVRATPLTAPTVPSARSAATTGAEVRNLHMCFIAVHKGPDVVLRNAQ